MPIILLTDKLKRELSCLLIKSQDIIVKLLLQIKSARSWTSSYVLTIGAIQAVCC